MRFAAGPPTKWLVKLIDASVVEVWADGFSEEGDSVVFSVLADASDEEQRDLEISGRTPSRAERVIITVARFPVEALAESPWSA